jgi:hypothetical protein
MARSGVAAAKLLKGRGESVFVTDSGAGANSFELDAAGIGWEAGNTPCRTSFRPMKSSSVPVCH